jgi:hypothetical protein
LAPSITANRDGRSEKNESTFHTAEVESTRTVATLKKRHSSAIAGAITAAFAPHHAEAAIVTVGGDTRGAAAAARTAPN